jgi:hypothetical protein
MWSVWLRGGRVGFWRRRCAVVAFIDSGNEIRRATEIIDRLE